MRHLAFVHTAAVHVETFGALAAEIAADVPVRHTVAAPLLARALRAGAVDAELEAEAAAVFLAAAEDAAVVVCTCSTFGPVAERAAARAPVPILRIDRAMAERAVAAGPRIAVAACVESTVASTTELIERVGRETGRRVEVEVCLIPSAWERFERGDAEGYAAAIAAALRQVARRADVIVLAQASMAVAAARCGDLAVPVLSSPRLGVEAAVAVFRAAVAATCSAAPMEALVLASGSARRRAYLEELAVRFEVVPADIDERPRPDEEPEVMALRLAAEKARAVARRLPQRWVLAADTVVALGPAILAKPADRGDARRMLRLLSGRQHRVITGVCLLAPDGRAALDQAVVTRVAFRPLTDGEIEAYVATGEADDKAGAYGIQGGAGAFVAAVEGSYSNVVGLPLEVVEAALRRAGLAKTE